MTPSPSDRLGRCPRGGGPAGLAALTPFRRRRRPWGDLPSPARPAARSSSQSVGSTPPHSETHGEVAPRPPGQRDRFTQSAPLPHSEAHGEVVSHPPARRLSRSLFQNYVEIEKVMSTLSRCLSSFGCCSFATDPAARERHRRPSEWYSRSSSGTSVV